MHVVIVDGDVSYPATSGKRLRTLNLMLQSAKRHQITYVGRCAKGSVEDRLAPPFLTERGVTSLLVYDPLPKKSGLVFYARLFLNLFSFRPYSVTSHDSKLMWQTIRQSFWHGGIQAPVDVWQVEWPPYLAAIDPSLPGPRVAVAHNVDTLIWQRYYENEASGLK